MPDDKISNQNNQGNYLKDVSELSSEDIGRMTSERLLNSHEELAGLKINSKFSESQIKTMLNNGERGDSALYLALFKNKFLYDHIGKRWYYWNDHYWREDLIEQCYSAIEDVIEVYDLEKQRLVWAANTANKNGKPDEAAKYREIVALLIKRIDKLNSFAYLNRVVTFSKSGVNSLAFPGDKWDQKSMVLVVNNGCINLEKGEFKAGNPEDYLRVCAPVDFDNSSDCPEWKKFLYAIFGGDKDVILYIQKLLGYSLTGTGREHIFAVFYGIHGRNGKTTMFEVLKAVLGEHAYKADKDFLIKKNVQKTSGAADSTLMALQGKKVVWCSEVGKGEFLDLPKVKSLTGGDSITARGLWAKREITFEQTFTTFMLTNRLAHVDSSDEAFWQRTVVIPFNLSFVKKPTKEYERPRDKFLVDKLLAESSGILKWLVQGCLLYQRDGIDNIPDVVATATDEYRKGEDLIRSFLNEFYIKDKNSEVSRPDMFDLYKEWCADCNYKQLGKINFNKDLSRRFGDSRRPDGKTFFVKGLRRKSFSDESDEKL